MIILPYAGASSRTLLHVLLEELAETSWTYFRAAVAFASVSGNFPELISSMVEFAERGGSIDLTFGADSFGVDMQGTERAAIEHLFKALQKWPKVRIFLYHERVRTFHPKLYLFSDEKAENALMIVGSSNWSYSGFVANVEANLLIRLDLRDSDHLQCYETVIACFKDYWQE